MTKLNKPLYIIYYDAKRNHLSYAEMFREETDRYCAGIGATCVMKDTVIFSNEDIDFTKTV